MIPLYRTVGQLGLINTHLGLALTYTALQLAVLDLSDDQLLQRPAARDHRGRRRWTAPAHSASSATSRLPLSRPALRTMATLNFLWLFNELLFGLLIMQDDDKRTLPVGLATLQGQNTTPVPLLASGLLISLVPVLVVFFFAQRHLARGLTLGAVK